MKTRSPKSSCVDGRQCCLSFITAVCSTAPFVSEAMDHDVLWSNSCKISEASLGYQLS